MVLALLGLVIPWLGYLFRNLNLIHLNFKCSTKSDIFNLLGITSVVGYISVHK